VNISVTFTPVPALAAILLEGGSAIIVAGYAYITFHFSLLQSSLVIFSFNIIDYVLD
jgi:hypothetical protein